MNGFIVSDWRVRLRYWSVQLHALAALLLSFALELPQHAIHAAGILPPDFLREIPREYFQYAAFASVVAGVVTAFIRQRKLAELAAKLAAEQAAADTRALADAARVSAGDRAS